jgi:hypothetical protein
MMTKPDNRALRALFWFVVLIVPGGAILLALFAAEAMQRRYRAGVLAADPELSSPLSSASLSSVGK